MNHEGKKERLNDEWKDVIYAQLEGSDILFKEQYLEFQHDNFSTELNTYNQVEEDKIEDNVGVAVEYADELVKQLKGE